MGTSVGEGSRQTDDALASPEPPQARFTSRKEDQLCIEGKGVNLTGMKLGEVTFALRDAKSQIGIIAPAVIGLAVSGQVQEAVLGCNLAEQFDRSLGTIISLTAPECRNLACFIFAAG